MNDVTPDNAGFFNLPDATGAIISQVTPDSPAGRAGLKTGDVLRELERQKDRQWQRPAGRGQRDGSRQHHRPGILRDGKPDTIKVTVGEFHGETEVADNSGSGSPQRGRLGVSVGELTPDLRQQLNIPAQVNGAAIQSVRPASPADDAGLAPGNVILEVNRHPVKSPDSFVREFHSVPAGKDILLLVWSKGGASYRVLHPAENAESGM